MNSKRKKLLAVSSGGGHWVQLLRLAPAFADCDVVFVTVHPSYRADVQGKPFYTVIDATRHTKLRLLRSAARLLWFLWKDRPGVISRRAPLPAISRFVS